ncbi:hypothetical protein A6R68_22860 [Neotoma lepida]|uniref:Uncharacterized protein n=1 Tax=Neotoma lepida TaxID=56216 RepID=A0A1A6HYQ0_NEOLE|nr:hypothetical protein A6R68_22860 [Neotoma lepida]
MQTLPVCLPMLILGNKIGSPEAINAEGYSSGTPISTAALGQSSKLAARDHNLAKEESQTQTQKDLTMNFCCSENIDMLKTLPGSPEREVQEADCEALIRGFEGRLDDNDGSTKEVEA